MAIINTLLESPAFTLQCFIYALLGGLLPALIWLWFWMHENHDHHENKNTIWETFLLGMLGVLITFPLQNLATIIFSLLSYQFGNIIPPHWMTHVVLTSWAFIEEFVKYGAAFAIALRTRKVFDEPIDAFVYLMTAALGFAAMENTLYLLGPILEGNTLLSVVTGNMRFMGASLLHLASSGILSICISLAYYKSENMQKIYTAIGIITATLLHTLFNFLIIVITESAKEKIFIAFLFIWITIVLLILMLEKIKILKKF